MSDDDHKDALLWTAKPPVRQRRPGEPLWSLHKDHIVWACELRFHGESYGWEALILREAELHISRRFLLKEHAARWAERERDWIERGRPDQE